MSVRETRDPPRQGSELGREERSVDTLWTALIALLILKYLKLRSTFGWSLSNLIALLQFQLFTHRDLWAWLNDPFTGPPPLVRAEQLVLPGTA